MNPIAREPIRFWNGNKSAVRARYERDMLEAVLAGTETDFGAYQVVEDRTDYPRAEDEGDIFRKGADLLVTVAGNPKFAKVEKRIIHFPLVRGLLGKRLLIIRAEGLPEFEQIATDAEMKTRVAGIPATWADAGLFRVNGYAVHEEGSLEDIFQRLAAGQCDYVSLGCLEIEETFAELAKPVGGLAIEPTLMLEYDMPLLFHVRPGKEALARRIQTGLNRIDENGTLARLFSRYFESTLDRLALDRRRSFHLKNPLVPEAPIR